MYLTASRIGLRCSLRIHKTLIFLLPGLFFISCKKDLNSRSRIQVNDTTYLTLTDTGSKTIGATIVPAMFTDTVIKTSFSPSAPVNLSNQHNLVIEDISTSQIKLFNCTNITIKNCQIGPGSDSGIDIRLSSNISVDSCYLSRVSTGVFVQNSQTITVTHCQARNMLGPYPAGQFVQFQNVSGTGNRISFNKFENILGESYAEDAISLYKCNGLPSDPIMIEGNWLRGGGPSGSGGGIMLGDGGGSDQMAKNNILVDPGQYGMAVSGGTYMSIINNTIYAKAQSFTNVGVYYRNYSGPPSSNIVITKNAVNYTNSVNQLNDTYLGPGDPAPIGWDSNIYDPSLSKNILPQNIVSTLLFGLQ